MEKPAVPLNETLNEENKIASEGFDILLDISKELAKKLEEVQKDYSNLKLRYTAACDLLEYFVQEFDNSENLTITPNVELIEAARFSARLR